MPMDENLLPSEAIAGYQPCRSFCPDELAVLLGIAPPTLMVERADLLVKGENDYLAVGTFQVGVQATAGHFPQYPMMRLSDLGIVMSTVGNVVLLPYLAPDQKILVVSGSGLHTLSHKPLHIGDILVILARKVSPTRPTQGKQAITASVYFQGQEVCRYDRIEFVALDSIGQDIKCPAPSSDLQLSDIDLGKVSFQEPAIFYQDAPPTLAIDAVGVCSNPACAVTKTFISENLCGGYRVREKREVHFGDFGRICSQTAQPAIKLQLSKLMPNIMLAVKGGRLSRHSFMPVIPGDTLIGISEIEKVRDKSAGAQLFLERTGECVASFDRLDYASITPRVLERIRPQPSLLSNP